MATLVITLVKVLLNCQQQQQQQQQHKLYYQIKVNLIYNIIY